MSALVAMQVDNVEIHVNGPEIPAMDGSASPFVFLLECAGLVEQDAPRSFIQILAPISVVAGDARAVLMPGSGLTVDFGIDFPAEAIGRQSCRFYVTEDTFKADISRARTFCMIEDLPKMRDLGLALGGSLDNALVVNGSSVLNEGGLRYGDEFVRHKALDAIGDLALLGSPVCGHYKGWKSSHMLNAALVQALLADLVSLAENCTVSSRYFISSSDTGSSCLAGSLLRVVYFSSTVIPFGAQSLYTSCVVVNVGGRFYAAVRLSVFCRSVLRIFWLRGLYAFTCCAFSRWLLGL